MPGPKGRQERPGSGRGAGRGEREAVSRPVGGGVAELVPDRERPHGWTLLIDNAPQSHVDPDDPTHLSFAYQRRLGHVIDLAAPRSSRCTSCTWAAARSPRPVHRRHPPPFHQQIVELDAPLVQFVRDHLPLDPQARIRVRAADAREGLGRFPDGWADLVIADVFSGARTPAHLTSTEFLGEVRRC